MKNLTREFSRVFLWFNENYELNSLSHSSAASQRVL